RLLTCAEPTCERVPSRFRQRRPSETDPHRRKQSRAWPGGCTSPFQRAPETQAKVLLRSDNVERIVAHALALDHQRVATIAEASREAALHPNDGIDRNLS